MESSSLNRMSSPNVQRSPSLKDLSSPSPSIGVQQAPTPPTEPRLPAHGSPSMNGANTARMNRTNMTNKLSDAGASPVHGGAQTARQMGQEMDHSRQMGHEIDLSMYTRGNKINRTRTNILQTSLMVPFQKGGAGWSNMKRFKEARMSSRKFMSQPKFAEEGKGTVKFSRAHRWKDRDSQLNSNAPGPGHYAKPEDNRLRGPVYAFSSCPRDTDPTRIAPGDREWKVRLP